MSTGHRGRIRAANQYGFRKGVSTESTVEKILNDNHLEGDLGIPNSVR